MPFMRYAILALLLAGCTATVAPQVRCDCQCGGGKMPAALELKLPDAPPEVEEESCVGLLCPKHPPLHVAR